MALNTEATYNEIQRKPKLQSFQDKITAHA